MSATLTVVTGKGGVGKTTVAAALALAAAAETGRAIVCEVGGQQRLPALFGVAPGRGDEEVRLADGLWHITIDPLAGLDEWLATQLPRRLVPALTRSGAFRGFVEAAPGARELVTMTKAWELGQVKRWRPRAGPYARVVLDAPASGHGLGILRTPRTYADIARIGPIASQARKVDAALRAPGCTAYVGVALAEELAVSETLELERRLEAELGRGLDVVVANAVWPRRMSTADAARIDGAAGRAARLSVARVAGQQAQLTRLRRHATAQVHTLPFVFTPRMTHADVAELAARTARWGAGRPAR